MFRLLQRLKGIFSPPTYQEDIDKAFRAREVYDRDNKREEAYKKFVRDTLGSKE
jgi:hypothetical protein